MNFRRRIVLLLFWPLPALAADVAWPLACDAAWQPAQERQLQLVSVRSEGEAELWVAAGFRLLARFSAEAQASGRLTVDDVCVVPLEPAPLAQRTASAQQNEMAIALNAFARARGAAEAGQPERAADTALQAVDRLSAAGPQHAALRATMTAFAAEQLRDAGLVARARASVAQAQARDLPHLHAAQPAALRLALMHARTLNWPEALLAREALRPTLAATFGADAVISLDNEIRIGNALMALGRFDDAQRQFARVQVKMTPNHPLQLLLLRQLSNIDGFMHRYDAQLDKLRELQRRTAQAFGADDRRAIAVEEDIARALADADRMQEALVPAARVYLYYSRLLGPDHARTLQVAQLMAQIFGRTHRFASARATLDDSMQRVVRSEGKRGGLYANGVRYLAEWTALDGDVERALELMHEANAASVAHYGPESVYTLGVAVEYGWLLARAGRAGEACAVLRDVQPRVRQLARGDGKNGDDDRGSEDDEWADAGLARCLLEQAKAASHQQKAGQQSQAFVDEAVQLLRGTHARARQRVGSAHARTLQWQAMLATAELSAGRRTHAKALLIDFVAQAEALRAAQTKGAAARDATFARWVAEDDAMLGYRTAALLHAQDGELPHALRIAELARDRRLRERFAEAHVTQIMAREHAAATTAFDVSTQTALAEFGRKRAELQVLDERIAVAANVPQRVRLEAERALAVNALAQLPVPAALQQLPEPAPPTVAHLQARQEQQARQAHVSRLSRAADAADTAEALIALQRAGAHWWALVFTANAAPRIVQLDDKGHLTVLAQAWARQLRGDPMRVWRLRDGGLHASYARPAQAVAGRGARLRGDAVERELSRVLLQPLLRAAPRTQRWTVVADDALVGVPLAALPVQNTRAAQPQYAGQRIAIAYAPSLTALMQRAPTRSSAHATWQRELLALGVADYGAHQNAANNNDRPSSDPTAPRNGAMGLPPLPFARAEVLAISAGFNAGQSRQLLDANASKSAVLALSKAGELQRYRYIHMAAHAFVDPAAPERAAIALTPDRTERAEKAELAETTPDEGFLNATELAGLPMGAELLTLSACDTGVGRYEHGQGLLGLAYAALAAGNQHALLSLWPVADDTTARFMAKLYARLRAGQGPAQALAATQRAFAQSADPRERDPRAWAGFVLYGTQ